MEEKRGETPRPVVTFFQPCVNQVLVLLSVLSGCETAVRKFLPKSHLSNVIIRDNTSVQRVQDIKLRHIEDSKKKVSSFFDQMKKKFVHDQQKKMARWKKEYDHYQRILQQIEERATKKVTVSNTLMEAKRSSLSARKQSRLK